MVDSIASASMSMQTAQIMQTVNVSLLKNSMDTQTANAQSLIQSMSDGVRGMNIDTYA